MAQDDGLELPLGAGGVTVLARQHVHLSLVHAQLTDIRLLAQPAQSSGLDAGVQGRLLVVGWGLSQEQRTSFLHAREWERARHRRYGSSEPVRPPGP